MTPIGSRTVYANPVETIWFTLVFNRYDSAEVDYYSFQLSSTSDVSFSGATPSSASIAAFQIFDNTGYTAPDIFLRNMATGAMTGQRLGSLQISSMTVHVGQWNVGTQTYINTPANTFQAWLSTAPNTVLTYNSASLVASNNAATPSTFPISYLLMQSQITSSATTTWSGETFNMTVLVNNTHNITTSSPGLVRLPSINWDPYVSTTGRALSLTVTSMTVLNADGTATPVTVSSAPIGVALTDITGNTTYASTTTGAGSASLASSQLNTPPLSLKFTYTSGPSYPVTGTTATAFTNYLPYPINGTVDLNGPWINGYAPAAGNTVFLAGTYNITPASFGVSGSYELDWIGVQTIGDPAVITWLSSNVPTLVAGAIQVNIYARVSPDPTPQWNPSVHAGTYFENGLESYFYVNPVTVGFTGGVGVLPTTVQQGAPVVVYPQATPNYYYRQVAFFNYAATPYQLSLVNTETVSGNGTSNLYVAYPNIKVLSIKDVTDPNHPVTLQSSTTYSTSNVVPVNITTASTSQYAVQYEVIDSFYVDNDYQGGAATPSVYNYELATPGEDWTKAPRAVVVTSNTQAAYATYESSVYSTATPVTSVPLSPLYTTMQEGFIYLSHQDYPLDHFTLAVDPTSITADGQDYALLSIYSYDAYGNPVPNQTGTVATQYTTVVGGNSFITDFEGHAVLELRAPSSITGSAVIDSITVSSTGVTPSATGTVSLQVQLGGTTTHARIRAAVTQNSIRANGQDLQMVYGQLVDSSHNPVSGATITWTKARTNFDLFASHGAVAASGSVTTDAQGRFFIAPITASSTPGYWFMAVQCSAYGAGDVVFWLEYPDNTTGMINTNGVPSRPVQLSTPTGVLPDYAPTVQHPVYYSQATPVSPVVSNLTPTWLPPNWYALPQFTQWQLGLYSSSGTAGDWSSFSNSSTPNHPALPYE